MTYEELGNIPASVSKLFRAKCPLSKSHMDSSHFYPHNFTVMLFFLDCFTTREMNKVCVAAGQLPFSLDLRGMLESVVGSPDQAQSTNRS